jgi:uncharacterized protein
LTPVRDAPRITSFLVKIASRCNLACDYCYVYEHADQSWRDQPRVMSTPTRDQLAMRLGEYAEAAALREMVVVFHGGEPLLAGAQAIVDSARAIRSAVRSSTEVGFCLQTNGTLIDEAALVALAEANIGVSLSLDGPARANDLHRLDHAGRSSFGAARRGLELLKSKSSIYSGLIAVIDPRIPADEVFSFVSQYEPPRFDFLLPDANHERQPPHRNNDPDVYVRWLIDAFDVWFDRYAHLPVRLFEAILDGLAGLPSGTDALGVGDVTLLTIETDGSFHDLDVLKITWHGATALAKHADQHSIADVATSPEIAAHRRLLSLDGLAPVCQRCPEVGICGGGSVPHRYSADGFTNPTIYCREMLALIAHARSRIGTVLREENVARDRRVRHEAPTINFSKWNRPETSDAAVRGLMSAWATDADHEMLAVLETIRTREPALHDVVDAITQSSPERRQHVAISPSVVLWTEVMRKSERGQSIRGLDGRRIAPDVSYVNALLTWLQGPGRVPTNIHRDDPWLRAPFVGKIIFEEGALVADGHRLAEQAFTMLAQLRPALLREIQLLVRDIQFISDPSAHPEKAVSFSDNCVPGAVYLSIRSPHGAIDPLVFAESLIHEYRHQKLYLLQRETSLVADDTIQLASPWREDPRPPSGLLHAVFVFTELYEYWIRLAAQQETADTRRFLQEARVIAERLHAGFATLANAPLTDRGRELADLLYREFRSSETRPAAAS